LDDQFHVDALRFVNLGRQETELTYFEFNTLAALKLMSDHNVDYLILEVGLGGRLDSTNIVDADLAVITSIGLDHQDWLGDTIEQVGFEKAGIFRANQQVVCGEPNPPQSLQNHAQQLQCNIAYKGEDFGFELTDNVWNWRSGVDNKLGLPVTKLPMTNAATALEAFKALGLSLSDQALHRIIGDTSLPGRLQSISTKPEIVLDVAHNPQAGGYLANWLTAQDYPKVHCVCAMLGDKDSQSTLRVVAPAVDCWYFADLHCARGAKASQLASHVDETTVVGTYSSVTAALAQAKLAAGPDDLILVFDSFFTVSEILSS